jgi:D-alanyl-D-alanine carboxypeptidase (penicillin-binding protein 5/6)
MNKKRLLFITGITLAALLVLLAASVVFARYVRGFSNPSPRALAGAEEADFAAIRSFRYPERLLSPLPYRLTSPDFTLAAGSVMVVDAANGSVLFEKNADEVIPPASLTKLVVMYVLFQEIAAGRMALDDVVPLPPESWAINAPPGSSLMFLGPGQIVTLRELFLGLAVSSGNDAAVAAACYAAGSEEAFCRRMNAEMAALGLTRTRFVDTSGYSEFNTTTAREFAAFARRYVEVYPQALGEYHAQRSFAYPTAQNYPGGRQQGDTIVQAAKNNVLNVIAGADGLKTGYIDESGYNLALTVQRDGSRFISVTLKGPGRGAVAGSAYRLQDARAITDWFFLSFYTRPAGGFPENPDPAGPYPVAVLKGRKNSLCALPAWAEALTVPVVIPGQTARQTAERLSVAPEIPSVLQAPVNAGDQIGTLVYQADGIVLAEVPLIADRSVPLGNPFKRLLDAVAGKLIF